MTIESSPKPYLSPEQEKLTEIARMEQQVVIDFGKKLKEFSEARAKIFEEMRASKKV